MSFLNGLHLKSKFLATGNRIWIAAMSISTAKVPAMIPWFGVFVLTLSPLHAESLDRELLAAVQQGDEAGVRTLLAEGANPNFRRIRTTVDFPETTALREAIRANHTEIMKILLEQNLDDRVLSNAMRHLPYDSRDAGHTMGRAFSEILLEQGRFEILTKNARHLRSESALRRILEHGPVNDSQVMLNAINQFSWETVLLASAGLEDAQSLIPVPAVDRGTLSYSESVLRIALTYRVARRLHEEERTVEMMRDLQSKGVKIEAWGKDAQDAATQAKKFGLVTLAEALSPDAEAAIDPPVITDEDRMGSAWLHRDIAPSGERRSPTIQQCFLLAGFLAARWGPGDA